MKISKEAKTLMKVGYVDVNDINKVTKIVNECKSVGVEVAYKGKLGNQYCLVLSGQKCPQRLQTQELTSGLSIKFEIGGFKVLSKELRKQIKHYQIFESAIEAIWEINKANSQKVLNSGNYINEFTGERITEPEQDYCMSGEDFKNYIYSVYEENKKAGLMVYDPNRVPEADFLVELKHAEDTLLKLQLEIIPTELKENIKKAQQHWKYRDEAINLILRLEV